ncbi:hypothetical protein KRX57_10825, partial [Weeksellaceae bacterium TAE3-ERU29]|nr:hypothetical protein [Weeksellaceae bacterium TAE3-ERU29]
MIEILLTYIYILYISVGMGIAFRKFINIKEYDIFFTSLMGMFFLLIISTFYAVFFPINFYFYILSTLFSTIFIGLEYNTFRKISISTIKSFKHFSKSDKFLFISIIILSLIHSSSLPYIIDNESYYIQTIKWLNNYGLVKGLANLHLFLGQNSGWHLLQSAFNFDFLHSNFNDLNGFIIILLSFFCLDRKNTNKKENRELDTSLIFIFISLLFLFISAPSPDLPLIVIVPIIFYLFIEAFNTNFNKNNILLIWCLSLFVVLIKVTIAPILILPIILLFKTFDRKTFIKVAFISLLALSSFIIKNSIISGYPLYPLTIGNEFLNIDWRVPIELQQNFWESNNESFINGFLNWINQPFPHGIINKLILISILLFPAFIRKEAPLKILWIYILIQFCVFYLTSPQYRFFLPVLFSITLIIFTRLLKNKPFIIKFLIISNFIILAFTGFLGANFERITGNDIIKKNTNSFIFSQIFKPRAITQYELEFEKQQLGNLTYFSPKKDSLFFWQTSNGPLPCANKKMIEYFKT